MHMSKLIQFPLLLLAALSGCTIVQGSGRVVTQERTFEPFHAIELSGIANVEVVRGPGSITVTTDDNLQQYVRVRVANDRLIVDEQERILLNARGGIKVAVSMPDAPTDLSVSGTGSFRWADAQPLATDSLAIDLSGTGSIHAAVSVAQLKAGLSGTGSIELTGAATDGVADLSGTGNLHAFGLQLKGARVEVSGTGSAEVSVSDSLEAIVSGTGSIHYRGSPAITQDVSGTGRVVNAN
jgi:hypothetical protein